MAKGPTKGQRKIQLQFQQLIESDEFQNEVRRIRRALDLPDNGIRPTKEVIEKLAGTDWWLPEDLKGIMSPEISKHKEKLHAYEHETKKLIDSLPVASAPLAIIVRAFIFYGDFFFTDLKDLLYKADVCEIEDAQTEFENLALNDDPNSSGTSIRTHTEKLEDKIYSYPVVLRIHADASQRDVVEFIKKNWNEIDSYQKRYTNPDKRFSIKNSKTKLSKKTRDDFIYEHRHLRRKEIMSLVADTFNEHLDYAHIAKIISLKKKSRK